MGLLGDAGMVTRGDIWYKGKNLPDLPPKELRRLNGTELGMIFQSAGSSFCPIRTIGAQLYETMTEHEKTSKAEFLDRAMELLLDGHGVPGNGAFPNGFSSFGGEKVTTETYDPEGAKAVLEGAGWVDTDGDGIREKDGVKLTIRWLTYPSRQELPLLAESVQASLKEIGMDVDINCTANRREFLADMSSFDIYASALVTAPSGDPQYFFTTSCLPGMSYNFGAYENEKVSAMIEELSTEFDTAKRGELAVRLQQAILDDNAYVFCSFLQMNMISKTNVTGYTAHACDYYQVTADLDIN